MAEIWRFRSTFDGIAHRIGNFFYCSLHNAAEPMFMAVIRRLSNRIFVTGLYYVAKDAGIEAKIPERCPRAESDATCRITKFSTRKRTCGMGYPLWICICSNHNYHFTVYPPGWIPFARNPIVHLTPDGKPIEIVHSDSDSEEASPWSFTMFKSVIAAAAGRLWPEEKQLGVTGSPLPVNYHGVARTQKRGIKFFMKTFGLSQKKPSQMARKSLRSLGYRDGNASEFQRENERSFERSTVVASSRRTGKGDSWFAYSIRKNRQQIVRTDAACVKKS